MVKVCHVTSAHESTDVRIFQKECVSLANAEYDTYLVAQGDSREEKGVHIVGVGNAPLSRMKRMTKFSQTVYNAALELDCDIYHLHDPELLPYGLKLKKHGKVVFFDSHENTAVQIAEKRYIPVFLRKIVSRLYRMWETAIVREFDAVIVPCTFDGKNIFEGRAKKTVFVANYPRIDLFSAQYDRSFIKEYDFCYVGGLTFDRGIYHLVKAAGEGNLKLLLIGKFNDNKFEQTVRGLAEFDKVTYLGEIPNCEVARTVQQSLSGCNTLLDVGQYYHFDTFGVKVPEYMAVGLPVIMNDSPFARKMVDKYNFGICVKPDEPGEIVAAVRYIKEHPEEAIRMGENGRKSVMDEFNWATQERNLIDLYKEYY